MSAIPVFPEGNALVLNADSTISPTRAPVIVQVFLDLHCFYCANHWPVLEQLVSSYMGEQVTILCHCFSLPFHPCAFYALQGAYVVSGATAHSTNAVLKYFGLMLTHESQQQYLPPRVGRRSTDEIVEGIGDAVAAAGIMSKDAFLQGMLNEGNKTLAEQSWKYCVTRGVSGTPSFFINGSKLEFQSSTTLEEWKHVIYQAISAARIRT